MSKEMYALKFLFEDTIKNNIRYARPNATDKDIEEACKKANCHDFIIKMEKRLRYYGRGKWESFIWWRKTKNFYCS